MGEAGFDPPAKLAGWLRMEVSPLPGFPLSLGLPLPPCGLGLSGSEHCTHRSLLRQNTKRTTEDTVVKQFKKIIIQCLKLQLICECSRILSFLRLSRLFSSVFLLRLIPLPFFLIKKYGFSHSDNHSTIHLISHSANHSVNQSFHHSFNHSCIHLFIQSVSQSFSESFSQPV